MTHNVKGVGNVSSKIKLPYNKYFERATISYKEYIDFRKRRYKILHEQDVLRHKLSVVEIIMRKYMGHDDTLF